MKYRGHTHLMVALEEGRTEIATSLLQHGVFILPEQVLISYPCHFHGNIPPWFNLFQDQQKLTALHIACRDGRTDMADLIIQAAEKQAMISHSGKYVKYQANIQTLLNMAGLEVELVSIPLASLFYACWHAGWNDAQHVNKQWLLL